MDKKHILAPLLVMFVATAMGATLSQSPEEFDCHDSVTWTGSGYNASEVVTAYFDDTQVDFDSVTTGSLSSGKVTADSSGNFEASFTSDTIDANLPDETQLTAKGDGADGNVATTGVKTTYCESYGEGETGEALSDSFTGLFAGIAPQMDTLGMGIIGLIVFGLFIALITKLGDLKKVIPR